MTFDFEDGSISIVNADKYKGYVDSDWQLDQLFQHFNDQMNNNNLIIWKSNKLNKYLKKGGSKPFQNFLEATIDSSRQHLIAISVNPANQYRSHNS